MCSDKVCGLPWVPTADGLVVTVRLTPRGGRDAVDGIETLADGRSVLKVRVRAAPTEGEANAALVRVMAKIAAVAARQVHLVAGDTSRIKRLKIEGDGPRLAAAITAGLGADRK
jgi:uncharacterized protein (TIGR00251 family)